LAAFGSLWQPLAAFGSLWQPLAAFGSLWQPLAIGALQQRITEYWKTSLLSDFVHFSLKESFLMYTFFIKIL